MNQNHLPGCCCNNCGSFKVKLGDKFVYGGKIIEAIVLYKDRQRNKIGYRAGMCRIAELPGMGYKVIAIHPTACVNTMICGIEEDYLLDRIKDE